MIRVELNPTPIGRYDRWRAVVDGTYREITIAPTQKQCFEAVRIYARRTGAAITVYRTDGTVLMTRHYPKPKQESNP